MHVTHARDTLRAVDAISDRGVTLMQQGHLQQALPLLQQVLEQRLQLLHKDDPQIGAEI